MNDLMLDLETLGNKSNSVILSISALQFDLKTGELGEEFHIDLNIDSQLKYGSILNSSTLLWWLRQTDEARSKLQVGRTDFREGLIEFESWLKENFFMHTINIWGNSARFDCGILEDAYNKIEKEISWKFYNEHDVRTLVSLIPSIKRNIIFKGVPHYGIDDCKHQIKYCSKIYKKLKISK